MGLISRVSSRTYRCQTLTTSIPKMTYLLHLQIAHFSLNTKRKKKKRLFQETLQELHSSQCEILQELRNQVYYNEYRPMQCLCENKSNNTILSSLLQMKKKLILKIKQPIKLGLQ